MIVIILLLVRLFQLWEMGLFQIAFCAFSTHPILSFIETSLLSRTTQCPEITYIFFVSSLESTTFLRRPGSFYWIMWFRNQPLGTTFTHTDWNVTVCRYTRKTELGNVCMHANLCIPTCLFCVCVCVCVCVCMCIHTFFFPYWYLWTTGLFLFPLSLAMFLIYNIFAYLVNSSIAVK